jgi:hypothetical protein
VSKLGALGGNGGPTQTMLLLAGNPAAGHIPNGTGVLCPLAADQTGRPSPPGGPCNPGALQAHPKINNVAVTGAPSAPKLTITGSGFATKANLGKPQTPCDPNPPAGNGSDYAANFSFSDTTGNWQAGKSSPCAFTGLVISSYSNTKIVFSFGSTYPTFGALNPGDNYTITLLGATFKAKVA